MNARIVGYVEAALVAAIFLAPIVGYAMLGGGSHPAPAASVAQTAKPGREYIIAGAKPNLLFVVDPMAKKVVHRYEIPGDGPPYTIVPSPDGKIAYVLTNHMNGISGIDIDTGKVVFRTVLSTQDEMVRAMGGIAISRDGKEIYVQESATKLLPSEYRVEPARIAVYSTAGGLDAKPVRSFETPRRIIMMMPSVDGKLLYALGWDLYAFDPKDGRLVSTQKVLHWDRPNSTKPDILDVWPLFEQSEVFSAPYFYTRTDKKPGEPGFARTGVLTLDLRSGAMKMKDFEDTAVVIFSTVVNPVNHDQVFGVYSTLSKIDAARGKLDRRLDLAHTYYAINVSSDGKYLYLGGAMSDIAVYTTSDMRKVAEIPLPEAGDMATASFRVVRRE